MNKWLRFRWNFMYNIISEQTDGKYLSVCHSSSWCNFLFINESAGNERLIEIIMYRSLIMPSATPIMGVSMTSARAEHYFRYIYCREYYFCSVEVYFKIHEPFFVTHFSHFSPQSSLTLLCVCVRNGVIVNPVYLCFLPTQLEIPLYNLCCVLSANFSFAVALSSSSGSERMVLSLERFGCDLFVLIKIMSSVFHSLHQPYMYTLFSSKQFVYSVCKNKTSLFFAVNYIYFDTRLKQLRISNTSCALEASLMADVAQARHISTSFTCISPRKDCIRIASFSFFCSLI